MNRLYNLDYLRGLAAFGIMIYHFNSFLYGRYEAQAFMGRIGVYGVALFYVLSGLTLYYVYHARMKPSLTDLTSFFTKRVFRIYPLLWVATLGTIILNFSIPASFISLALNLTGLFGFVSWGGYFATGAWSIGNELVFYAFFPVFIFLTNKTRMGLILFSLLIFAIYLFFAFKIFNLELNANKPPEELWWNYVNPLNQVFLFLGGFLIGKIFTNIKIPGFLNLIILFIGLGILFFYPTEAEWIYLISGTNRLVFTFSCFLICLGFYKINFKLPYFFDKPLTLLGEASYSIYLLHPLVYLFIGIIFSFSSKYFYTFPDAYKFYPSIILTLVVSYFMYEKFEKYFMKLGRKIDISKKIGFLQQADQY